MRSASFRAVSDRQVVKECQGRSDNLEAQRPDVQVLWPLARYRDHHPIFHRKFNWFVGSSLFDLSVRSLGPHDKCKIPARANHMRGKFAPIMSKED